MDSPSHPYDAVVTIGGHIVYLTIDDKHDDADATEISNRIVATWNACSGYPTELLSPGLLGEQVALKVDALAALNIKESK